MHLGEKMHFGIQVGMAQDKGNPALFEPTITIRALRTSV
jgi:hypothetical protein